MQLREHSESQTAPDAVAGNGNVAVVADRRVPAERLHWHCNPEGLPFETTEDVPLPGGTIGQERAASALELGLEMEPAGFNLFVTGLTGTERTSTTRTYVERVARDRPRPDDLLYVYNFSSPSSPEAINLPAGTGAVLAQKMKELYEAARRALIRAFETREYRQQRDAINAEMEKERAGLVQMATDQAKEHGLAISPTPSGLVVMPLNNGHPMTPEEFHDLPEADQQARRAESLHLIEAVQELFAQAEHMERDVHLKMADLDREVALNVLAPLITAMRAEYGAYPKVVAYLDRVQEDMVAHQEALRNEDGGENDEEEQAPAMAQMFRGDHEFRAERYEVNVVVDNGGLAGAPVVFEANPTYYNLLGRIEYHIRLGAMVTDFHQIKAGALHRANGGFLVLHVLDVLANPFAWDALKRTLRTEQIRIENLGEQLTMIPTTTLRPEPVPARVKVILIGPPLLYYLLSFYDEDFRKLFKIKADFDVEMAGTAEHVMQYAAFLGRHARKNGLRHFDRTAVARIAEYGARLAENQEKLSTRFREIGDLAAEASHWAGRAGSEFVRAEHVNTAIDQMRYRSNLIEDRFRELITDRTIMLDVEGSQVGRVNGLSVIDLGDHAFGRPVRVSAQTAVGSEGIVNVEREAHLSGPIYNKAFQILTGFLMSRYAQDKPLSLAARVTFEQSYDEVEGDSASSTELYALLSALAELPLQQGIAVTGSVNQFGEVQAVGGVTQKIEGFFDVCAARGLTGAQGVIVPEANLRHLMLRDDVVEAVRSDRFHIWAVRTIDQGIEILTRTPAGSRQPDGTWEPNSVNDRVDRRLREYAEALRNFGRSIERGEAAERVPAEVGPQTPRL